MVLQVWTPTSSISVTRELVRKTNLWTSPQSYSIRNSGNGTQQPGLTNPPSGSDAHQQRIIKWPFLLPLEKFNLLLDLGVSSVLETHWKSSCQYIVKVILGRFEKWLHSPIQSNRSISTISRNPLCIEIDDAKCQLQVSWLQWELLWNILISVKAITSTITIANIYIMLTIYLTLLLDFINMYPLNFQTCTQVIWLALLYLYSPILQMRKLRQRDIKWSAKYPTTPKGQRRVFNLSRWPSEPPLLNPVREAAWIVIQSAHFGAGHLYLKLALSLTNSNHLLTALLASNLTFLITHSKIILFHMEINFVSIFLKILPLFSFL